MNPIPPPHQKLRGYALARDLHFIVSFALDDAPDAPL